MISDAHSTVSGLPRFGVMGLLGTSTFIVLLFSAWTIDAYEVHFLRPEDPAFVHALTAVPFFVYGLILPVVLFCALCVAHLATHETSRTWMYLLYAVAMCAWAIFVLSVFMLPMFRSAITYTL